MKHSLTHVLTLSTMLLISASTLGASSKPLPPNERPKEVMISFVAAKSAAELIEWSDRCGAEPTDLAFRQEGLRGGYRPAAGEDISEALVRADQLHEDFLQRAIADNAHAMRQLKMDGPRLESLTRLNHQMEKALADFYEKGGLTYSQVVIENNPGLVTRLIRDGEVTSVNPLFERAADDSSGELKSTSHESWAPYRGVSTVNQSYTYQTFYFDDLSAYPSDGTYECETQVYDKNYADYDGYWNSNLPEPYYDTPFLDSIDNFTVGSAEATSIITFTEYYTYMSLKPGTASSATVRIKGQRGNRTPAWCYSTWCIFADATTGSMAVFTAPVSNLSWTY